MKPSSKMSPIRVGGAARRRHTWHAEAESGTDLTQLAQNAAAESILEDLAADPRSTMTVEVWAKSLLAKKGK
jgi:hypothetical protein